MDQIVLLYLNLQDVSTGVTFVMAPCTNIMIFMFSRSDATCDVAFDRSIEMML